MLVGELEMTTLNSFCEYANLKAFLQRPDLNPSVRETALRYAKSRAGASEIESKEFIERGSNELPSTMSMQEYKRKKRTKIKPDVRNALSKIESHFKSRSPDFRVQEEVVIHTDITMHGKTFTSEVSPSANVFCLTTNGWTPCIIRELFSICCPMSKRKDSLAIFYFAVVQLHRPAMPTLKNPFEEWKEFGANLWSKSFFDDVTIQPIRHGSSSFVHAIKRDWDEQHIVAKPLSRVRLLNTFQ